jgi:hypothetical protein
MTRPHTGAALCAVFAAALAAAATGCSDSGSVKAIDQKAVIEKASGGDGKARQSPQAKAASEEAGVKHPKLK